MEGRSRGENPGNKGPLSKKVHSLYWGISKSYAKEEENEGEESGENPEGGGNEFRGGKTKSCRCPPEVFRYRKKTFSGKKKEEIL